MAKVLIPLPSTDFDPTETAVPWSILRASVHEIRFSTPDGRPGAADDRMLTGRGLGLLSSGLKANADACLQYSKMANSPEFLKPLKWSEIRTADFDALMLPGGHAPGMRPYLEAPILQSRIREFFELKKPVAAICHGVLAAARTRGGDGHSVLRELKVTALPQWMEYSAWAMTCVWLGSYYRTYPMSVEAEVKSLLQSPEQFFRGPLGNSRDDLEHLDRGFTIRDGSFLSARWPGDAHRFATHFLELLAERDASEAI